MLPIVSLKQACRPALLAAGLALSGSLAGIAQNFSEVKPAPQQTAWQDLEFGVIVHFTTNTFLDREWGDGTADPKVFNPGNFDPDQWMKAVKASGAGYVVFVAKHHDGFCLWPTEQTEYSIKASPWKNGKGDMVGDVARAARANGLQFGVYLSPWDRHDSRYKDSSAYDKYYGDELTELASHYGNLVEFWLDGAGSGGHVYDFKKIIETLRTYQPNSVVFADTGLFEYGDARWVGTEDGRVPYENWNVIDRHGVLRWRPVEADTPLRNLHWFWHPNDEKSLKGLDELLEMYEQTVGHGSQLMLGLAPDQTGQLPASDVARLTELGKAIEARYGKDKNLAAKQHVAASAEVESALDNNPDSFWSAPAGSNHSQLVVSFAKPVRFNRALTMEWLNDGQRVQKYSIEALTAGGWKTIAKAEAIGHKKIDRFEPVTATKVRLNILSSTNGAAIREFQIFDVQ